jgi:predicted porin
MHFSYQASRFIACASLLAASSVWAQSSVQLGGQIKIGTDRTTISGVPLSRTVLRESNNTSFWYLTGTEELSSTARAYFRLEFDFAADTGAMGAGRNIYLGLGDNRFGRVQFGRQSVYFSHHWTVGDPHGSFDTAPNAANSLNVLGTINGAYFSGGFLNNTVRYEAPNIAGFSGMMSYSFDAEAENEPHNRTLYINPTYTNGNLKLGLYHMKRQKQGSLPGQTLGTMDQAATKFAIGYTWDAFQFGLIMDRNKVTDNTQDLREARTAFAIPVVYTYGANTFSATYGKAFSTHHDGVTLNASGMQMLSLSYMYALSKRTSLDLTYIQLRNQRNGRYNFWLGGIGGSQLALTDAGARPQMIYAGLKHVF